MIPSLLLHTLQRHASTIRRQNAGHFSATALLAAFFLTSAASAGQIFLGDGSFGFHSDIYAKNEVIYVTGLWDTNDFPCPIGDVYLVPNDRTFWGTHPIGPWMTKKPIQGCPGGEFVDVILKLPELPLGEYDIVMDEHQDGTFNQGEDYILGDGGAYALKVVDQTLDQAVDVHAIKASAQAEATSWKHTRVALEVGLGAAGILGGALEGINIAAITASKGLGVSWFVYSALGTFVPWTFFPLPTSYNGGVIGIGKDAIVRAADARASVNQALADDPPDAGYTVFAVLDSITSQPEISDRASFDEVIRLANNFAQQAAIGTAFLHSYERFLGAEVAENYEYARLQARRARHYCGLLIQLYQASLPCLDSLEAGLAATGSADHVFSADTARILSDRVIATGFTSTEHDAMISAGMTPTETDSARAAIAALDLADATDASLRDRIAAFRSDAQASITNYTAVASDLDGVLSRLQYAWTDFPTALVTGAGTVAEGSAILLSGDSSSDPRSGALTFAWDLDMDGTFDDASGSTAMFIPNREGEFLVGLKVTNPTGRSDVAYARVIASQVNRIPAFTSIAPASIYIHMSTGGTQNFSVAAQDPDGDAVTFQWLVNDVTVGTGNSHDFTPVADGTYEVRVRASDGSPLSPDNDYVWRVVAAGPAGIQLEQPGLPRAFRLYQARPNPFEATISAGLDLAERAHARATIYGVTGRQVAVLADRDLEGGQYRLTWDARDASGMQVAPGIYYLVVDAGSHRGVLKLVRIR